MSKQVGRRPGANTTRSDIALVAMRQFAKLGYDRTTFRSVAAEADVDPALVVRFYKTKRQLFAQVTQLPFDASSILPGLIAGDKEKIGERVSQFLLNMLESPQTGGIVVAMVRAAATEPEAAELLRQILSREIFAPLTAHLEADQADFRATLAAAQVVGVIFARYITATEPLASADPREVIRAIAPTLQRYLVGPLN